MSDDHRSSNSNHNGDEKEKNGENKRKSSSLITKQNSIPNNIATSGAHTNYNKNM